MASGQLLATSTILTFVWSDDQVKRDQVTGPEPVRSQARGEVSRVEERRREKIMDGWSRFSII